MTFAPVQTRPRREPRLESELRLHEEPFESLTVSLFNLLEAAASIGRVQTFEKLVAIVVDPLSSISLELCNIELDLAVQQSSRTTLSI